MDNNNFMQQHTQQVPIAQFHEQVQNLPNLESETAIMRPLNISSNSHRSPQIYGDPRYVENHNESQPNFSQRMEDESAQMRAARIQEMFLKDQLSYYQQKCSDKDSIIQNSVPIAEFEQVLKERAEFRQNVADLEEKLECEQSSNEQNNLDMTRKLNKINESWELVKTLNENLASKAKTHQADVTQLQCEIVQLNTDLRDSQAQVKPLQSENEKLLTKLENCEDEMEDLQQEINLLKTTNKDKVNKLEKKVCLLSNNLMVSSTLLKTRDEDIGELQKVISSQENSVKSLQEKNLGLEEKLKESELKLEEQSCDIRNQLDQKNVEVQNLSRQLKDANAQLGKTTGCITTLEKQLNKVTQESKGRADLLRNQGDALIKKEERLKQQLEDKNKQISNQESTLKLLKGTIKTLTKQAGELQLNKTKLEKNLEEKVAQLETKEEEINKQRKVIDSKESSMKSLQMKKLELEEKLKEKNETISKQADYIKHHLTQVGEIAKLRMEIAQVKSQNEEHLVLVMKQNEQEKSKLATEVEELTETYEIQQIVIEDYEKTIKRLTRENSEISNSLQQNVGDLGEPSGNEIKTSNQSQINGLEIKVEKIKKEYDESESCDDKTQHQSEAGNENFEDEYQHQPGGERGSCEGKAQQQLDNASVNFGDEFQQQLENESESVADESVEQLNINSYCQVKFGGVAKESCLEKATDKSELLNGTAMMKRKRKQSHSDAFKIKEPNNRQSIAKRFHSQVDILSSLQLQPVVRLLRISSI